jgi:hypothetical protein
MYINICIFIFTHISGDVCDSCDDLTAQYKRLYIYVYVYIYKYSCIYIYVFTYTLGDVCDNCDDLTAQYKRLDPDRDLIELKLKQEQEEYFYDMNGYVHVCVQKCIYI